MPPSDADKPLGTLAQYVTTHVDEWRRVRDQEYGDQWAEAYALWRGRHRPQDKEYQSERSQAIMPVLSQAVDAAVEELEAALFDREQWLDLLDVPSAYSEQLVREIDHWQDPIADAATYGALYGTAIGLVSETPRINAGPAVDLMAIHCRDFVIDPMATRIDEGIGCALDFEVSISEIEAMQRAGIYDKDVTVMPLEQAAQPRRRYVGEQYPKQTPYGHIIEWHGLVPSVYLDSPNVAQEIDLTSEVELTEAIVTVANDQLVLRANENPYPDRGFVAYQDSRNPGSFWGRSVHERGRWPQRVLDTEIRARNDALALNARPMMGIRAGALGARGTRFRVRSGATVVLARSAGEDSIRPIRFPAPDPQTYQQTQDMERLVNQSTGTIPPADPFSGALARTPSSGFAMASLPAMRRSSQRMRRLVRSFLAPAVKNGIRRLESRARLKRLEQSVIDRLRIAAADTDMSRILELAEMKELIALFPEGPARLQVIRTALSYTPLAKRTELLRTVDAVIRAELQPKPPGMAEQLAVAQLQLEQSRVAAVNENERLKLELEAARDRNRTALDAQRLAADIELSDARADKDTAAAVAQVIQAIGTLRDIGSSAAGTAQLADDASDAAKQSLEETTDAD